MLRAQPPRVAHHLREPDLAVDRLAVDAGLADQQGQSVAPVVVARDAVQAGGSAGALLDDPVRAALQLPVGVRIVVEADPVGRLRVGAQPLEVELREPVVVDPTVQRVLRIDAPHHEVEQEEAAQVAAPHVLLERGIATLERVGGVARQDGRFGLRAADGADRAARGDRHACEHRHVAAPAPAVRRPEAEVAAEQARDERLVEGAPGADDRAVALDQRRGEPLQAFRKARIADRLPEPARRAEVHDVEDRLDAQLVAQPDALVGERPVEAARRGLQRLPGERVAQVAQAELASHEAQVVAPEAIVLGPLELVDVEMRNRRALDADAPEKVFVRLRRHASPRIACCESD